MELPLPRSHGTVVQFFGDAGNASLLTCPDVDTCDQDTNPACLPGGANYPVGGNTFNNNATNPFTNGPIGRNLLRESRCAAARPPAFCIVQSAPCENTAELLSYYDGAAPAMALFDEGPDASVTADSPSHGINLTFVGAVPYKSDSFSCTLINPATGLPVSRRVNLFIGCDAGGTVDDALAVQGYIEQGQCQYYVLTSHKLACGAAHDPYDPLPSPPPPAGSAAEKATYAAAGAAAALPLALAAFVAMDASGCLGALKCRRERRAAAAAPAAADDDDDDGDLDVPLAPASGMAWSQNSVPRSNPFLR